MKINAAKIAMLSLLLSTAASADSKTATCLVEVLEQGQNSVKIEVVLKSIYRGFEGSAKFHFEDRYQTVGKLELSIHQGRYGDSYEHSVSVADITVKGPSWSSTSIFAPTTDNPSKLKLNCKLKE